MDGGVFDPTKYSGFKTYDPVEAVVRHFVPADTVASDMHREKIVGYLDRVARALNDSIVRVLTDMRDEIEELWIKLTGKPQAFDPTAINFRYSAEKLIRRWESADELSLQEIGLLILQGKIPVRESQIETAVDAMVRQIVNIGLSGLVIGAMQSGKSGTILATIIGDTTLHAIFGMAYSTQIVVTEQVSLYQQTTGRNAEGEMTGGYAMFQQLLGGLEVYAKPKMAARNGHFTFDMLVGKCVAGRQNAKPVKCMSVAQHIKLTSADDGQVIYRRQKGLLSKLINDLKAAKKKGLYLNPRVDESHYGDSGKLLKELYGRHIGNDIFNLQSPHRQTAFSATPFPQSGTEFFVQTRLRLGSDYTGVNYYGGAPIDPRWDIKHPTIASLDDVAACIPDAPHIHEMLNEPENYACKAGISVEEAKARGVQALDALIRFEIGDRMDVGICVRACRRNSDVQQVREMLAAEEYGYEAVVWNCENDDAGTIERKVKNHLNNPDRKGPLVIFVTAKARMGDDFPAFVELFIDLTLKTETDSALLQGLFGRACGWFKPKSKVYLSDANANRLRKYIHQKGAMVDGKPCVSASYENTDGYGRAIYLTREQAAQHPQLAAMFEAVEQEIVFARYPNPTDLIGARTSGSRVYPLLDIIERFDGFDILSDPDFQRRVMRGRYRLFRPGDTAVYLMREKTKLDVKSEVRDITVYQPTSGNCHVLFRHMTEDMALARGQTLLGADRRPLSETSLRAWKDGVRVGQVNNQLNLMIVDEDGKELMPATDISRRKGSKQAPTEKKGRVRLWAVSLSCMDDAEIDAETFRAMPKANSHQPRDRAAFLTRQKKQQQADDRRREEELLRELADIRERAEAAS